MLGMLESHTCVPGSRHIMGGIHADVMFLDRRRRGLARGGRLGRWELHKRGPLPSGLGRLPHLREVQAAMVESPE